MLKFKKSLGQNLLTDKNIINKIVSLEHLTNEHVFEIGAGLGNLTNFINKKKPKSVFLIEKDERFYKVLKENFGSMKNYKILNMDILKYNLNSYKDQKAIVFGNLPYNISTQILAKFIKVSSWPPFYKKIIFMFQQEVANKILAKHNTKEYGRITILTNVRLDIIKSFKVSKKCFFPIPEVDSKVIVFKPKIKISHKIKNIKNLEKITHVFFSNKRKMINKPLSKIFKNYKYVAKKLKIDTNIRPSELSCEDYYRLTECYEEIERV